MPGKYLDPRRYYLKSRSYYYDFYSSFMRDDRFLDAELQKFKKMEFDFGGGLSRLNEILAKLGQPTYLPCAKAAGMASIHWLLFACISLKANDLKVLEIGTYDGVTSRLLAQLFPYGKIITCDLKHDDPIFLDSYDRSNGGERKRQISARQQNLKHPNIRFVEENSFFSPAFGEKDFGLIWVDGAHHFPEVSWDLSNAYYLCTSGGFIMCDDVLMDSDYSDEWVNSDSYRTLERITKITDSETTYFLKRVNARYVVDKTWRKYVSVLKKGERGKHS